MRSYYDEANRYLAQYSQYCLKEERDDEKADKVEPAGFYFVLLLDQNKKFLTYIIIFRDHKKS